MLDKNDGVRRGPFGSALKKEIFVKNSDYVVYEQQNAIYDNYKTRYNITKEKFDELHKFSLKENDFIMSGAGTIGRISRVPKGIKKGVFNQALIRFRINNELTNPEYFLQFVRAENMQRKLTGANPGSAISNLVPMSEVKKWEVFVPIKAEQKKLGSFFEQLDDTIALHQRQLDNYKELKKAMLKKIFNQELKFKDQDGNDYPDWKEKKLGEIAEIRTGYTPSRKDKNNFGGDIIWVSVADMKTKYIYDTKEYLSEKDVREAKWIEADTLIMSFKLSVGVLAITKKKCMSNEAIANFQWKNDITNNEYMFAYLSSQDISTYGNNAAQGISLNNESLREIRVQVPCKGEQQKIAGFFIALDKQLEKLVQTVELLKEQKKRLMQQMFC